MILYPEGFYLKDPYYKARDHLCYMKEEGPMIYDLVSSPTYRVRKGEGA